MLTLIVCVFAVGFGLAWAGVFVTCFGLCFDAWRASCVLICWVVDVGLRFVLCFYIVVVLIVIWICLFNMGWIFLLMLGSWVCWCWLVGFSFLLS